jgi:hypothetical protein
VSKGEYLLRLDADERKMLEETSAAEHVPMSVLIREGIQMRCKAGHPSSSAARKAALNELAEVAAKLARGHALTAPAPVPHDHWADLMERG